MKVYFCGKERQICTKKLACTTVFRLFSIVEEIACYLRQVLYSLRRPSASPRVSVWFPLDRFPWNFIFGTFINICRGNPIFKKSYTNIEHFTWTPKYVFLLLAILNPHKTLSWNEVVSGCQGRRGGINIRRTCRNFLYVHQEFTEGIFDIRASTGWIEKTSRIAATQPATSGFY